MKYFFVAAMIVFALLYAGAELTASRPPADGRAHMRWSTDAAGSRSTQSATFTRDYPDCQVTVDPGLGNDNTKLYVQCLTGVGPDIIDVYSQEVMAGMVQAGVLLDLTPYAKSMGFDPGKTYPSLREGLMVDGKQYRYPCNVWANVMIYNKELFTRYGVPEPTNDWTWDDFIKIGVALSERSKDVKGRPQVVPLASYHRTMMYQDLLVSHGGRRYTPDGLMCVLDSPQGLAAMQLFSDLIHKYRIIPSPTEANAMSTQGGWGLGGLHWFSSQRAAMIPIGRWYLVLIKDPGYADIRAKLRAVRLPHAEGLPSMGVIDSRASAINVKSPHREAALKWMQYLASESYNQLIVQDGDALPPNPRYAQRGEDLVNPVMDDAGFHQLFIDAARSAKPLDISPFIDPDQVSRLIWEVLGKVESHVIEPAEAARSLTKEVNLIIRQNLRRRPELQKVFEQRLPGLKYTDDWWKTYKAAPPARAIADCGLQIAD